MTARAEDYAPALRRAHDHVLAWLAAQPTRPVAPRASADELRKTLGGPLPEHGTDPADVVDRLATEAEPGLMGMPSGRFFGWVIGGTLPAALAADWLVAAWDQNAALRTGTPATAALEEVAGAWLLELLGLPADAGVGFVTGATMANFSCLAAARYRVLERAGHDVHTAGLTGAPRVRVLVGEERHDTVDAALRYLGLGKPDVVEADERGVIRIDALRRELAAIEPGTPVIVCLQAGNIHSGDFDDVAAAVTAARGLGAWVHVDGAFGLWARAVPRLAGRLRGVETADSWATDAHKTLNVPYDCGVAVVADRLAMRAAFGLDTSYLIADRDGPGDPHDTTPELSRRARGVPVWAALSMLGRDGVARLVDGLANRASQLARGVGAIDGADVLNDVVFTQVCVAFGDDARTREVTRRLLGEGAVWMSGSRWRGRDVLRISVSNWSTDDADVEQSVAAVRRAVEATGRPEADETGADETGAGETGAR